MGFNRKEDNNLEKQRETRQEDIFQGLTSAKEEQHQKQTSKNFYYPTGSNNFRISTKWLAADCDGKGEYITIDGDQKYHVGADIVPTDSDKIDGSPVYAISDGLVVYRSDKPTSGWGDGNIALVIKHEFSNGQPFFAVYGHIRSNLHEGKSVYAGKSFATIGPFFNGKGTPIHHLHFGINLGRVNSSTGKLVEPRTNLGMMSCSKNQWPKDTNGFEDPIEWIETQKAPSTVHPIVKDKSSDNLANIVIQLEDLPSGFHFGQEGHTVIEYLAKAAARRIDRPDGWLRRFNKWGWVDGYLRTFKRGDNGGYIISSSDVYKSTKGASKAFSMMKQIYQSEKLTKNQYEQTGLQLNRFEIRENPSIGNESMMIYSRMSSSSVWAPGAADQIFISWRRNEILCSIQFRSESSFFDSDVIKLAKAQDERIQQQKEKNAK